MRLFPRIDRYVLRELTVPSLLGLTAYTFVLLMNHLFLVADKALAKNLSWNLTLRLFLAGVPSLLVLSIPMAILLGTLVGVGRLSADHEWLALQTTGQGPLRLLRPTIVHGLVGTLASVLIYAYVVPQANYALRNVRGQILFASNLASDLRPRVFYTDLPNAVLYVDDIRSTATGRLLGVFLVETDVQHGTTELIIARRGDLYPAADGSGALVLDLYEGTAHVYQRGAPAEYRYSDSFGFVKRRFDPAAYLKTLLEPPVKVVQDLSPRELWHEYHAARAALDKAPRGAGQADRFVQERRVALATIELNQRLALPLASLLFAMLALPLGITRARTGKAAGFALSLLVILVYWVTFTTVRDLAIAGRVPAQIGPWAGNMVILPWGLFALVRMRRGSAAESWWHRVRLALGERWQRRTGQPATIVAREAAPALALEPTGSSSRWISRIDAYVGFAFLRVLLLAMGSAYLVYSLVELKGLLDDMRGHNAVALFPRYFLWFAPGVLHLVLPISCMVAGVVCFTLLARSGELTAIKVIGMSLQRATLPVIVITAALCGLLFLIQDRIAPTTNSWAQSVKDQITGRPPRTYGAPAMGRWGFGPGGRHLYHYQYFDPKAAVFQGLSVFTLDRQALRVTDQRFAPRARWDGSSWELEGGWQRKFPGGHEMLFEEFDGVEHVALDPPASFAGKEVRFASLGDLPEQMSLSELKEQIRLLRDSGYNITQLLVDYHAKFAHALAPLVMLLLGLPFAFVVGRRGALYGIGVALLLVLVYWAVFAISNALGLETLLSPALAAWAPNVLFGILGGTLLLYVRT